VFRDSVHDQLEPWRLQQDLIVLALRLAEAEDVGVERCDLTQASGKQHCTRA